MNMPLTREQLKHAPLTREQFKLLEERMDAIRDEALADLGERDANYIRRIVRLQRSLEVAGRVMIPFSLTPIGFGLGVACLSVAKILENMEIGHNVMHGQYDWMNDPSLHSQSYEWDTACDSDSWRRTHNYEHHTYTNVIGKDRDYGYAVLRLGDHEPWKPHHLFQFVNYGLLSTFFQWGVALHELETEKVVSREVRLRDKIPFLKAFARKGGRQFFKDYIFFPLITFPVAGKVLLGNALANLGRNLWASTIIFCGHFTEQAQTFDEKDCENETRGQWYYRQMTGSSNFTGGRWLHIMSGHLSYQMEHHIFPDIPAHRYPEISEKVQAVCKELNIPYNTASFGKQYLSVLKRILRFSLPPRKEQQLQTA